VDKFITFTFEHKKDKDQFTESYRIDELIYGVGETKQPVKEFIEAYKEDGYILVNTI